MSPGNARVAPNRAGGCGVTGGCLPRAALCPLCPSFRAVSLCPPGPAVTSRWAAAADFHRVGVFPVIAGPALARLPPIKLPPPLAPNSLPVQVFQG